MKIVTFVKHVPSQAVTPRLSPAQDRIEHEGLSYEVNEVDLYVLEEALAQRAAHKGSVIAVTIGAAAAKEALSVAYAKGVDHGIHVVDEETRGTNATLNVQAAAEIARRQNPPLILTGIQAEDDLQGQFGIALAEALDLPVVTAVTGITASPADNKVTVIRELGAGVTEEIEVDLPCVLTVQFGIRQLRYVPLMAIFKMKSRAVEAIALRDLAPAAQAAAADRQFRILQLAYPDDRGHCEMIGGPPSEAARQLMAKLTATGVL